MNVLTKCYPYFTTNDNTAISTVIEYNSNEYNYYIQEVDKYFNYLQNYTSNHYEINKPKYSEDVIRYEWPPWGLLTGYKKDATLAVDYGIRLLDKCIAINRKYKLQKTNPFVSSLITFYYGDNVTSHKNSFDIYEEFTFNSFNEITFIEAWSIVLS